MRAALPTIRQNNYTCECFPVKAITFRKNTPMAEIIEQGKCGDNLTWTLDDEGLLTISGEGEMWDYGYDLFLDSFRPYPFENNTNIIKVKISYGITSIGDGAFYGCKALTSIYIPNSVTWIGDDAFSGCKALTSIKIGGAVNLYYNDYRFCDRVGLTTCEKLTTIEIAEGVTSIGDGAFSGCKALTNIEIPNSVTSIGESAFEGCRALKCNEYDNGYYLGNKENPYIFLNKAKSKDIISCSISNRCKFVGESAFYYGILYNWLLIRTADDRVAVFNQFKVVSLVHKLWFFVDKFSYSFIN